MKSFRGMVLMIPPLLLAACASSPPARYFTLDDGPHTATVESSRGLRVVIVHVDLPDLVDRPQIVVRTAEHQVLLSEQNQWAAPLREQLTQVMTSDLGAALGSSRVVGPDADNGSFHADFRLMLDVQRLEVVAGKRVDLDAWWSLRGRGAQSSFGRCSLTQALPAGTSSEDYPAMVTAQSRILHRLAVQIAADIRRHAGLEHAADRSATE